MALPVPTNTSTQTQGSTTINPSAAVDLTSFTPEQRQAYMNAAALAPAGKTPTTITAPKEPTVLSNANVAEKKIPEDKSKLAQATANLPQGVSGAAPKTTEATPTPISDLREQGGTYMGQDGKMYYNYDSSLASGQGEGSPIPGTDIPSTGDTSVDYSLKQMNDLKTQMDATSAAYISSIQTQYQQLIDQQKKTNVGAEASINTLLFRGGSMRTGSAPGIAATQVSADLSKVADLQSKENQAVITAQQAAQSNDYKLLSEQLGIFEKMREEKVAQMQETAKTLAANKLQANKDSAIQQAIQSGLTDPAQILATAQKTESTVNSKDVADFISNMHPDAKNIMDLAKTAAENGASKDVLSAITNATSYTDALQAGAGWVSTNADVQAYNQYRSQATSSGQTPVSFDAWQSNKKYLDAYATAKGTAAGKAAAEGGTGPGLVQANIKSKADFPQALKPYANKSANGSWYLDLSSISSAQRSSIINQAGDIPIITDKNQANDLKNIKDAVSKLQTIGNVMKDITSPDALSRNLGGAGYSAFAAIAQTDPKRAAALALNDAALDILKAISGVQGFRGNQSAIQQVKDALPKITDTQDVAAQKLDTVAQLMSDRENAIVGSSGTTDYTSFTIRSEDQAKNALVAAGKNDSAVNDQITKILGEKNPDTGQPYTYLEAAQILGIDIPALSQGGGTILDVIGKTFGQK